MAIDAKDLKDWIDANGPYLFHATGSDVLRNAILKDGVLPASELGFTKRLQQLF